MDIAPITTKIYRLTQHILQHGDKMSTTTITGTDTKNVNAVVIWVSRHDILPAQYVTTIIELKVALWVNWTGITKTIE